MKIVSINNKLEYDFSQIAKQFFPYETFNDDNQEILVKHSEVNLSSSTIQIIEVQAKRKSFVYNHEFKFGSLGLDIEKEKTRFAKIAFYEAMVKLSGKTLDWGCLTGVRPSKIAYEFYSQNNNIKFVEKQLQQKYYLKRNKAKLITKIINQQIISDCKPSIDTIVKEAIFYINIPFCTSKCSYCSFISAVIEKCQNLVEPYVDALCKDIENAKKWIKKKKINIKSIYIGGGTPTSLNCEQLEKILQKCDFGNIEFTVEAGRPDTITREKLEMLKKYNVTRISINPQSFNQQVLDAIGRSHTTQDVFLKYKLAREYGFKINMDLIAGLPKDTLKSFKNSLKTTINLHPDNITVHTLALKTKAELIKDKNFSKNNKSIKKMVAFSNKILTKNRYVPYYLYRQKNMLENQENVGWSKRESICKYNIDSMEDFVCVIACGANAISKRIFPNENRIERFDAPKDIKTYIEKIDKLIADKKSFFLD